MRVGILGSGLMGGKLGTIFARAGHDVRVAANGSEALEALAGARYDLIFMDIQMPVMGGLDTEVSETTTDILLEAAHWDPITIARTARRHKLGSEASRRYERSRRTSS